MELQIKTISDQVVLFKHQKGYNDLMIADKLQISPQTVSKRIDMNDWRFDEIRGLKSLFRIYGLTLKY